MTLLQELEVFTMLSPHRRLLWVHSEASYSWGRAGDELEEAYRSYVGSLDRWARKKGRLVWTIHDEGLHLNDPDRRRIGAIRDKLREMADCVHVHSEAARSVVERDFGIDPSRIIVVRHPSYAPCFEGANSHKMRQLRQENNVGRRLLCFGHVKPYKNYAALADSLERLGVERFERLTIAGQLSGDVDLPVEQLRGLVDLDLRLRFISDNEVADLFADADFLVLPYIESLTSGAAALSMGFGVPVIAPSLGGMREAVPSANQPLIYSPRDPDGLTNALRQALSMPQKDYNALADECRRLGKAIHPDNLSAGFFDLLTERGLIS